MSRRLPYFDHARLYERLGLRILPVARLVRGDGDQLQCACPRGAECSDAGKHPLLRGWRDHSPDIARWWGLGGGWNIGIATGAVSGIVVIDIDPRHGGDETLAAVEREHGPLPPTWRFLTGGGGEHVLFRHPGGYVACGSNILGAGIDARGDGGFIVAPPSRHRSGQRYAISVDHHPDEIALAPLPDWLHARLGRRRGHRQRREKPIRPCAGLSRYGEAALDNACRRILDAVNGEQELTINGEAYSIGRLAGAGAVPADFALRALQYAARRVASYDGGRPWRGDELAAKVERSFGDGVRNPRRVRG
jgi:Bifunctional DNA primase/polymerase, N-terminal